MHICRYISSHSFSSPAPYLVNRVEFFHGLTGLAEPLPPQHVQIFTLAQLRNSLCVILYQQQK